MTSSQPVILSAVRTAIGTLNGGLSTLPAHELGKLAMIATMERAGIKPGDVDEVVMGQVLTAAQGQNPARQAAVYAGIPIEKTAMTINQVCGSGLRAVALAYQAIRAGDANVVIAGGQESMSLAPHAMHLRTGTKMGNATMIDTMVTDGLWEAFNNYHMGITAENVAKEFNISRTDQDAFAVASQNKAEAAQKTGEFNKEIFPVTIKGKKGDTVVNKDEGIRAGSTLEALSGLRPAFDKAGSVTAGNASGINDGAAALVVSSLAQAEKLGIKPVAKIVSWATCGVDPKVMGTGPIPASKKALEKAGWTINDLDLIEANEAFAAQACAVNKVMGWPLDKVNVNGGAIALGHPIGASGARVLTTLLHALEARGLKRGLATLCIGGGMGIAMCVER